jgi:hypothetical protein
MTTFPNSPKLLKGGLILLDAETSVVQRVITLQYNLDSLNRTLVLRRVKKLGIRPEIVRLDSFGVRQSAIGHGIASNR